jgi:hypothetical protein
MADMHTVRRNSPKVYTTSSCHISYFSFQAITATDTQQPGAGDSDPHNSQAPVTRIHTTAGHRLGRGYINGWVTSAYIIYTFYHLINNK